MLRQSLEDSSADNDLLAMAGSLNGSGGGGGSFGNYGIGSPSMSPVAQTQNGVAEGVPPATLDFRRLSTSPDLMGVAERDLRLTGYSLF